jgi:hypothetical protein
VREIFVRSFTRVGAVAGLVACGAATTVPPAAPAPSTLVQPARNIHLRASFDDDPTIYIGRFIPDGVAEGDIDENSAATTRCSQFIKPKAVTSTQEMDEVMFASQKANASLGVIPFGHGDASHDATAALRVKYSITKKMQSEVNAEGLDRCCREQPDQCSKRYISEFVMGTGKVFQQTKNANDVSAGGQYSAITGDFEVKDSVGWKRVSSFKDMYFAFQSGAAMGQLSAATASTSGGSDDCSWCEKLPSTLDGTYFCGISPDVASEAMSRDAAMRNAREQVVKYMGEYLSSRSKTQASLLKGTTDDSQILSAGAEGLASRVKDQRWCKAKTTDTPDGQRYQSRVLAYLPNDQLKAAAKDAIETLINKRKQANAITPEQEKALRGMEQ